jgi:hypothetical protein
MNEQRHEESKPAQRVIKRMADEKEVSPLELSPLFEAIDPDALNDLFHYDATTQEGGGQIQFEYEGHTVIVHSSGRVGVSEASE